MQLIFTWGLRDDSIYLVQPSANLIRDGEITYDIEQSAEIFYQLVTDYCAEQGIEVPERGGSDYYALLGSYDCNTRYYLEHLEDYGDYLNYYLYDDAVEIMDDMSDGFESFGITGFSIPDIEMQGLTLNSLTVVDEELAERLYWNLAKGKQLSATRTTGNVIEAVAYGDEDQTKSLHLGDEAEVQLYNFDTRVYETYTIRIAGILDTPFYLMDRYASVANKEKINLDDLVTRNISDDYTGYVELMILPFDGYTPQKYGAGYVPQRYFVNTENADFDAVEFENTLTAAGYEVASTRTAWQNSFQTVFATIASYSVMLIISVVMTFLTLFGIAVLHVSNQWRSHEIMKICGATYADHVRISMLMLLHLMTMGTVVGGVGIYIYIYI